MAGFVAYLVFILSVNFVSPYILIGDDNTEIVWPNEYQFNGEIFDLQTTLKTPFEIWYSAQLNRARMDYYNGVSKMFYNGYTHYVYMVFPKTDSHMNVEVTCSKVNRFPKLKDLLPDVSSLTFTGKTTSLFEKVVDIWTGTGYVEKYKMNKEETLYVYKTEHGVDIPVQYISKMTNPENGEVMNHKITNYYNFKSSLANEDLLKEPQDCSMRFDFKKHIHLLYPDIPDHLDLAFDSYTTHHEREYHEKEGQMRERIFEENWRKVREHNNKNLSYKLEVNQFSDRTPEELKYLNGLLVSKEPSKIAQPFPHTLQDIDNIMETLPENFDLRIEGAVTAVKNQGECGSCWAFATIAGLEGAYARINGGRLVDLSEQSVVDCSWSTGNMGCDGGLLNDAWQSVYENGVATERDYGIYTAKDGYCHINNATELYTIKGFALVTPRSPNALKVALYKYGPVTIGVKATTNMLHYSSGLFFDFDCNPERSRPNHAVTIVGYGNRNGEDYWIIKNSWGESWGEDGYILMKNNNCFILDYPVYPVV